MVGFLFVSEDIVNPYILATDSTTLIKANKGKVWHKSSYMNKEIVPRSGIDTDARWWDYSHTKGWRNIWI